MEVWVVYGFIVVFVAAMARLVHVSGIEIAKDYRDSYLLRQSGQFENLFIAINPMHMFNVSFIAALLISGGIFLATASVYASLPVLVVIPLVMTFSCGYLRRRRCKKFESQFPDALAMLNANMRAGISLANAMQNVAKQSVAPMSQELGMLEKELQVGKSEQAYRNLGHRIPLPSVTLFVSAVITCDRLGGNLSEMLDKIAETIRRNIQLRQELKTLTAEGRLQGIIMGLLPFIMGGILTFIDPDMMSPLYETTIGNLIIVAVIVLDLLGLLVICEILKIED